MPEGAAASPDARPEIVALANQKGGVGKTTTAINLAGALGDMGRRVLVVDWDPQANATLHAGLDPEQVDTIWGPLQSQITPEQPLTVDSEGEDFQTLLQEAWRQKPEQLTLPIMSTPNDNPFDVVASSLALSAAENELIGAINRERCLASLLEPVRGYDYILIDCPPSLGVLATNALAAADSVIIPLQSAYFSVRGMNALFRTLVQVRRTLNPRLHLAGILITLVDHRTSHSQEVVEQARQSLSNMPLFETVIPVNVALVDASAAGKCITHYAPESAGAVAYRAAAEEFEAHK